MKREEIIQYLEEHKPEFKRRFGVHDAVLQFAAGLTA